MKTTSKAVRKLCQRHEWDDWRKYLDPSNAVFKDLDLDPAYYDGHRRDLIDALHHVDRVSEEVRLLEREKDAILQWLVSRREAASASLDQVDEIGRRALILAHGLTCEMQLESYCRDFEIAYSPVITLEFNAFDGLHVDTSSSSDSDRSSDSEDENFSDN